MTEIDAFIHSMSNGPENFVLTDKGTIDKFIGVEIKNLDNNHFELSQPHLMERIIKYRLEENGFDAHANWRLTPAAEKILNKDLEGKPRKYSWKYRTAVGMLQYLQNNTRPDISMPVHQTARYANNRCAAMSKLLCISKYLLATLERLWPCLQTKEHKRARMLR